MTAMVDMRAIMIQSFKNEQAPAGADALMARPRAFDLAAATDRAVTLFWQRGYAATSVRDLCAAMQLNSGSFYAAFGDKAGCFAAALARYASGQGVPRTPSLEAIARWFDVIIDPARTPRGCLVVASAVESPLLDRRGQAAVQALLAAVDDFFRRCLAMRGLGAEVDAADAALLGAAVTAIHVGARAGAPPAHLRVIADRALAAVGLQRTGGAAAAKPARSRRKARSTVRSGSA